MRPLLDSTSSSTGSARPDGGCQTACAVRGHLSRRLLPIATNSARVKLVGKAGLFLNGPSGDSFACDFLAFPMVTPFLLSALNEASISAALWPGEVPSASPPNPYTQRPEPFPVRLSSYDSAVIPRHSS